MTSSPLEKLRANDPDKKLREEGVLPPLQEIATGPNKVIMSAIIWASTQDEFGSIDEVLRQLETGETDMNGLINAYMDAMGDMS